MGCDGGRVAEAASEVGPEKTGSVTGEEQPAERGPERPGLERGSEPLRDRLRDRRALVDRDASVLDRERGRVPGRVGMKPSTVLAFPAR